MSEFEPTATHEAVPAAPTAELPAALSTASASRARRRAGLLVASLLLVGGGVAGGATLALQLQGTTGVGTLTPTAQNAGLPDTSNLFSGGGVYTPQLDPSTSGGSSTTTQETASDATAAQSVGLVEITSTLSNGAAAGTGLILSSDGTVVTNHHVVEGATSIKVTVVSTGQTYTATYVGGDATADVAVIKLTDASGLTPVPISSTPAAANDAVTAVGDAGGNGGSLTASPGTVAALGQDISVQNDDGTTAHLTDLIEMNAYVVPGDSGGVVLNSSGQAVGMNVAASTGRGAVTGYAIPIATVQRIANEILAGSTSSDITLGYGGFLGVGLDPSATKPLVVQVEDGGAASSAGIATGSTITSLDGTAITSATQLRSLLAAAAPGDRVTIGWTTSGGTKRTATVTLGQAPIA